MFDASTELSRLPDNTIIVSSISAKSSEEFLFGPKHFMQFEEMLLEPVNLVYANGEVLLYLSRS